MTAATGLRHEEIAGTLPGAGDGLHAPTRNLILLDVTKIDGAAQRITADVFIMLQRRDERLAFNADGVRRLPLDRIWNPRIQIINHRRVFKTFDDIVEVTPGGTLTGAMTDQQNLRRAARVNRHSRKLFPAAFSNLTAVSFWVSLDLEEGGR